ncbi:metallophosphoesterase domain-containing protein 1 [Modicella reniformis]|uniref:Metallophosphoesterase domain-containing protein 1 n=1 Tax=Modicella reniformis TaxID=1440133 RepID=A0A9P6LTE9_9FUNG|nr:metallophosphoesterase domain-containing protein 1 [Modicella reniformis]
MFPKPKPPPQNFRVIHRPAPEGTGAEHNAPSQPLPPNVYISPDVPVNKPAPNWLRMVCISDTHNTTDANNYMIPEADILVHAGDFTKMGTTAQIDQFVCWMKSLKHIPLKIIIAGNHEIILDKPFYKEKWHRFHNTQEDHQAAVDKLETAGHGIVYLNNSTFQVDGAKILYKKWQKLSKQELDEQEPLQDIHAIDIDDDSGAVAATAADTAMVVDPREGWTMGYKIWASPWQPEFFDWAFNEERGKLKEIWKHIPIDTDILVTHGPPKYHGDTVPRQNNQHVGCHELLNRLKVVRPRYHVFGHIHEGYGVSQINWPSDNTQQSSQPTVCINASVCNLQYRPINKPIVVDLPPK